ncbi:neuronal acetylcholine receptor subunit alpha-7-like isoform X3 [Macrobrachium nipponense]|uniref:neuronal acetylcholine receptor subunit alpha-7-like isoform X3 n=1 Tax=Macrobrachium nipponense TaxID=159736 RepID=UPI0030C7A637
MAPDSRLLAPVTTDVHPSSSSSSSSFSSSSSSSSPPPPPSPSSSSTPSPSASSSCSAQVRQGIFRTPPLGREGLVSAATSSLSCAITSSTSSFPSASSTSSQSQSKGPSGSLDGLNPSKSSTPLGTSSSPSPSPPPPLPGPLSKSCSVTRASSNHFSPSSSSLTRSTMLPTSLPPSSSSSSSSSSPEATGSQNSHPPSSTTSSSPYPAENVPRSSSSFTLQRQSTSTHCPHSSPSASPARRTSSSNSPTSTSTSSSSPPTSSSSREAVLRWSFWPLVLLIVCLPKEAACGQYERRLLHDLLDNYNNLERPVDNETEPVVVTFGITLQQIIDVDEKNQILTTNVWLNMDEKNQLLVTNTWLKLEWKDVNLRWNESDYNGVSDLRIPPYKIWKPDVLMYNSADEGFDGTYPTKVVVSSNGNCLYIPPGIFKSTCKIDITWFPFDDQRCKMKFGSWTYSGWQLDLQLQSEDGGDLSDFIKNGEWDLIGCPGKRNAIYYKCCPEPYVDVTFEIVIRRRTLYYFCNLILPCVLIASMAVLGFTLPPDCGEKLSLEVPGVRNVQNYRCCPEPYVDITFTIKIRRRTIYYLYNLVLPCVMISSMSLLGFSLPPDTGEKLTLGVTILLSLTVFHNLVTETLPQVSDAMPVLGTYFNCIMFMVASSVVSTVLILNYHHRSAETHEMSPLAGPRMNPWVKSLFLQWLPWVLRLHRPGEKITRKTIMMNNKMRELELKERSSRSLLANVLDIDDDFRAHTLPHTHTTNNTAGFMRVPHGGHSVDDTHLVHTCMSSCTRELNLILKEIRVITDKMRKDDDDEEIANDWKFAAMVVDRLCLIVFTLFTITATIAVLLSAPHIIVP